MQVALRRKERGTSSVEPAAFCSLLSSLYSRAYCAYDRDTARHFLSFFFCHFTFIYNVQRGPVRAVTLFFMGTVSILDSKSKKQNLTFVYVCFYRISRYMHNFFTISNIEQHLLAFIFHSESWSGEQLWEITSG